MISPKQMIEQAKQRKVGDRSLNDVSESTAVGAGMGFLLGLSIGYFRGYNLFLTSMFGMFAGGMICRAVTKK